MQTEIAARFWDKVKFTHKCWEWTGSRVKNGYGSLGYISPGGIRKSFGAHRLSYYIHFGDFDHKLSVLHRCDNPGCVNPNHLFLGTQTDNIRDMIDKGRYRPKPRAEVCAKGHSDWAMYQERDAAHRRCKTCLRDKERRRSIRRKTASVD